MAHIEKSFLTMQGEQDRLHANQSILRDQIVNGSRKFELRIHELQDDLGTKPSHLLDKFDAPSLWGTVGMMGSSIMNREQEQSVSSALQPQDIERIVFDLYQKQLTLWRTKVISFNICLSQCQSISSHKYCYKIRGSFVCRTKCYWPTTMKTCKKSTKGSLTWKI